ncbi:MAG: ABC transporter substrate-binding protein [Timaviella obliquedivisa GSE-PSE-MK23-08B]|nr:ABC transporter substrate-binding protein [Timaviella obliquedivisa GSE-PSE-MK23-08B]
MKTRLSRRLFRALRQFPIALGLMLFLLTALTCCNLSRSPSIEATAPTPAGLRIYWRRGLFPEEDQALQQAIAAWERQSSIPVKLSLLSPDDVLNQAVIALENGDPPDIVFAHRADYTLEPRWALEDKLADVSDVVATVKNQYSQLALDSAYLYNKAEQKKSFYGVPIEIQALHIHYWRDHLAQLGLSDDSVPNDWDEFWQFWQQAQTRLRQLGESKIYGLGLTLSPASSDLFVLFEQILEAYNIEVLNAQGQLRLNEPQVRQGIITAMKWLTQLYQDKYIPPESLNWVDSDNNVNFLNHNMLMTANPSLSIPVSQRDDTDLYFKRIATREFPKKPDGEQMRTLISVKQALIFKNAKNIKAAKAFLTYFVEPDRLNAYLINSRGRSFPTMPSSLKDSFWQSSADPHISKAVKQLQGQTRLFYHILNPAYSQVQEESVWGQALQQIIVNGRSPEAAVDEAIARIQKIFDEWQNIS